jgi:hypothetical protein
MMRKKTCNEALQQSRTGKIGYAVQNSNMRIQETIFKRGMGEKAVKLELFMIEGEDNFESKSLRGKMNGVVMKSSVEMKERFYDMGVEGELPKTWDLFKDFVIGFCIESNIHSVFKYNNEEWIDYFIRLKDLAHLRGWSEEAVLRKIRTEKLPRQLEILFFSMDVTMDRAIKRIKEIGPKLNDYSVVKTTRFFDKNEKFYNKQEKTKKCYECGKEGHISTQCFLKEKKKVLKCYKCGRLGHISYDCNTENQTNNTSAISNNLVDQRTVNLNGVPMTVIFDTGASDNFICSGALRKLGKLEINQKHKHII